MRLLELFALRGETPERVGFERGAGGEPARLVVALAIGGHDAHVIAERGRTLVGVASVRVARRACRNAERSRIAPAASAPQAT
jgi:hypothetical protein